MAIADAWRAFLGSPSAPPPPPPPVDLAPIRLELDELKGAVGTLEALYAQVTEDLHETKLAVGHGIEHVDRVEARIRAVVRRAKQQLEEEGVTVPALEAESQSLLELDDERSPPSGVHAVRADVGGFDASDLPGSWRPEDLAVMDRVAQARGR